MEYKRTFYKSYFDISNPYEHQLKVWEHIERLEFPIFIKAPTGSGKTEAVIAPFLYQFIKKDFYLAPRLIYVLPMRVLVNSIAERIRKYSERVSPYISVSIQHGDLPNSPFFMSDIVVTTLDQFLYAFARASRQVGYHIDVPAGAIASSIVVFDEAHMYRDEFTFSIMRALMEILYSSNIPFVLMTATMPEILKNSLFENIPKLYEIIGNVDIKSSLSLNIQDKPLILNDELNLSDELIEEIKSKKTLIVLNQVKRAQKIYEELMRRLSLQYGQIVLLHSKFCRNDRIQHENKAISLMPHKERQTLVIPEGTGIVVSTQVLEAGIDFSAQILITEIAPADSLIQRAGRCARYEKESGCVYIFPLEGEKAYMPYERRHIEKTMDWLSKNKNFNIKDFNQVCDFVNCLDYKASDFEAADTLIDLYECVLYADEKPENIQLRKNKSAKVVVIEPQIGEKKKETKELQLENGVRKILREGKIGDYSFEVDIKSLWGWFKKDIVTHELSWEYGEKSSFRIINLKEKGSQISDEDVPIISPFKTYIIESSYYDSEIGVKGDESVFI
ncbi:MAG: CRISPR-associated helicase Cas3' [Thermodesulfovibrio sp.]|nr:CRISPR-associated helicase Cas3' [Thermodesulfovibrio sp.]